MSAPIATLLDDETVNAVAAEVWSALVGEDEVLVPGDGPVADGRSAWVGVEGPWSGLVVLTCSASATDDLTRAVLQLAPAEELADEDVDDVLRELANILGGNVKSLLPGPSTLGLPQTGTPPQPGTDVRPVGATWRGHPLTITVQGATEAPAHHPTTEVTP
ncbi:chemotaxis protein CheX [Geodermatophilaceae bacterium NBWT11]|nr:chemotaxis protein CheX [Geodermatophilaceae bacterium NBWT11]